MKYISTLFACLFYLTVFAQERFEVMGKPPDVYIEHAVKDGESLQSIGKFFGLPPAKIAAYNSLNPAAPLSKNSRVKIPLSKDNLFQEKKDNAQPVYHIIGPGDNLYQLSLAYNKVNIALLKEWNNLKTDVVKNGQAVIIGFIGKGTPVKPPVVVDNPNGAVTTPVVKNDVAPQTPAEKKPAMPENKKETVPNTAEEGYFAVSYLQHSNNQLKQYRSGDAAFFKTVSGWVDHKYYVLMNDVAVGTIVRISGGPSNKYICAKVLGPLQEIKGGTSLLLRMSNSAAIILGVADTKIPVMVTYFE
jgi:LysM repeat protein